MRLMLTLISKNLKREMVHDRIGGESANGLNEAHKDNDASSCQHSVQRRPAFEGRLRIIKNSIDGY